MGQSNSGLDFRHQVGCSLYYHITACYSSHTILPKADAPFLGLKNKKTKKEHLKQMVETSIFCLSNTILLSNPP